MKISGQVFRVMLKMNINEGMEEDFEKKWKQVGSVVTKNPSNLGQWLSRSAEEGNVYYIVSDWKSEKLFREFEKSETHRKHRKKLHPYRSSGSMTTMYVVYDMSSKK